MLLSCSSREYCPSIEQDSTIVYKSSNPDGINSKITLCRKVGKKTGKRIGTGTNFTIKKNEKVIAFIDLENRENFMDENLVFHTEWIDLNGKTIFRKQIDLSANDPASTLKSSISIPPGKREPGKYLIRLFLYRELIAEKWFYLKEYKPQIDKKIDIAANITFCKKISKKTGKKIGVGSKFKRKKTAKVSAVIDLLNRTEYLNRKLRFDLEWIAPNDKPFYTKKINIDAEDLTSSLKSTISIAPSKRIKGKYLLKVYLLKKLIKEKSFELL